MMALAAYSQRVSSPFDRSHSPAIDSSTINEIKVANGMTLAATGPTDAAAFRELYMRQPTNVHRVNEAIVH